jgi:spermidine synthase
MQVINTIEPGRPDITMPLVCRVLHDFNTKVGHVQLVYTKEFGDVLLMNGEIQSSGSDQAFYHTKLVGDAVRGGERKVVIFGGGEGCTAAQALVGAPTASVTQYDYDFEAMNWASVALLHWNKGVYNDPRLKVVVADADDVVLGYESADAVIIDLFDYTAETDAFMERIICKGTSALRPGGRLSAYLGDDGPALRLFVGRLQTQLGSCWNCCVSLAHIPSYGGANSLFLSIERVSVTAPATVAPAPAVPALATAPVGNTCSPV